MFGGNFGSFQSANAHFFNENHPMYRYIHDLCGLRAQYKTLRRGRQYLRQVSASGNNGDFYYPQPVNGAMRWVVAWSRIFADDEMLCAVNTDTNNSITVWATVDARLRPVGSSMKILYPLSAPTPAVQVEPRNGSAVRIQVPAGGFVLLH
jgi:hypothetical protein